jgi:hypothetical protein
MYPIVANIATRPRGKNTRLKSTSAATILVSPSKSTAVGHHTRCIQRVLTHIIFKRKHSIKKKTCGLRKLSKQNKEMFKKQMSTLFERKSE